MTELASADADVVGADFDHYDPDQMRDPHAQFRAMRAACPVTRSERHGGFWAVTGFSECEAIAKNPEGFSSRQITVPANMFGDFMELPPVTLDPPAHAPVRRILLRALTAAADVLEPDIAKACTELVDGFARNGACDASGDFARRIPIKVMSMLLGFPAADEDLMSSWVHRIIEQGAINPEGALAAAAEMWGYLAGHVEDHRNNQRDDLVGRLLAAESGEAPLDDAQIMGCLFVLISAGIDTTWSVLSAALQHLATNDEDRRRLVADPSLLDGAVEEFLRYYAPASMARVATQDAVVADVEISAGDALLLCYGAGNRDERAFPDAERFVLDRTPNRHNTFGVGIHRCVGAKLGKVELTHGLRAWLGAIPEFQLDGDGDVVFSTGQVWGPRRLRLVSRVVSSFTLRVGLETMAHGAVYLRCADR